MTASPTDQSTKLILLYVHPSEPRIYANIPQLECPPSPLQSVSTSASPMPMPSDSEPLLKRSRGRRASESALANSGKNGKRAQKRKHTWTPGMAAEGPNVSAEQKIKELQDLDRLMAGGPAFRRERRRLQNRLAQRAFRARSKISNKEVGSRTLLHTCREADIK